ncbi:SRPBCC family protein [Georgenia alba]|uniref:SRPBCC family protein n=1 Tax=Georgenia alba TaxID=2233858 RepID=A0ABW2Q2R0_9MICO
MRTTTTGTAVITTPSDTEILITREFNAPRHLVYRVFTEPEYVWRWWAGGQGTVTSVEMDFRVGGRWRYVLEAGAGFEVAFHGVYREIVPDERFVCTEVFEGDSEPDESNASVTTYTFTESGGRTTLQLLDQLPDKASRDAVLESGMEAGAQGQYDTIEQIAVELAEAPR